MRGVACDQEQAVTAAVASDHWTPQLQEHARSCVNCREVVRLSQSLRKLAAAPKPELPPAGYVWWRSQIHQRRRAHRRVIRLIGIIETATFTISITGLTVWIIWHWSELAEGIKSLLNSFSIWSSSGLASSAIVVVYLFLALLFVNLLLTIRAVVTSQKNER